MTNPCRRKNLGLRRGGFTYTLPEGSERIYAEVEKIWCRKGSDSNYPRAPFEHTFKTKPELWGLPDGSLLIVGRKGRRLWKRFRA